jgi:hypothetical protein
MDAVQFNFYTDFLNSIDFFYEHRPIFLEIGGDQIHCISPKFDKIGQICNAVRYSA